MQYGHSSAAQKCAFKESEKMSAAACCLLPAGACPLQAELAKASSVAQSPSQWTTLTSIQLTAAMNGANGGALQKPRRGQASEATCLPRIALRIAVHTSTDHPDALQQLPLACLGRPAATRPCCRCHVVTGAVPAEMDALTWQGKCSIAFSRVPTPQIQEPGDAIVRVRLCGLCGSDLVRRRGACRDWAPAAFFVGCSLLADAFRIDIVQQ